MSWVWDGSTENEKKKQYVSLFWLLCNRGWGINMKLPQWVRSQDFLSEQHHRARGVCKKFFPQSLGDARTMRFLINGNLASALKIMSMVSSKAVCTINKTLTCLHFLLNTFHLIWECQVWMICYKLPSFRCAFRCIY